MNPDLNKTETISPSNVPKTSGSGQHVNVYDQKMNSLIEQVFMITLNKTPQKNKQLVFIEDLAPLASNQLLNLNILEQALFERLLLPTPADFLIPNNIKSDEIEDIIETRVIIYLFGAYQRNERIRNANDSVALAACDKMRELIIRNASTAIKQPGLFEGQIISTQWLEILQRETDDLKIKSTFLSLIFKDVLSEDEAANYECLKSIFYPVFMEMLKKIQLASMNLLEKWIIPSLMLFVMDKNCPPLAKLLLEFCTPMPASDGIQYSNSLFGQLLSISILPRNQNGPYEYFQDIVNDAHNSTLSNSLWTSLKLHQQDIFLLMKGFLVIGGEVRDKMLQWIGNCLDANAPRGQIWNQHGAAALFSSKTAPDSFMIGLSGVLLRLCQPLFKPEMKVLRVDPTYCAVSGADTGKKNIHMLNIGKETMLLPADEGTVKPTADTYNFITEVFYMTHKAIDLSYRVCIEKFFQMNREFERIQSALRDATAQGGGAQVTQDILQMFNTQMPQILCYQNALSEPANDQLLAQFHEATAIWLSQIAARETLGTDKILAPNDLIELKLPLTNAVPIVFQSIPEFIVENIVGYLIFAKHFNNLTIHSDPEITNAIFSMILIFMGSAERVRNPHLRARLAEGLECLLPKKNTLGFSACWKSALFTNHPHRLEMVPNLLRVFVGIEMTGQSVQFEQKFNYRRPMYIIMEYLWDIDEQRTAFKKLAKEAERNMEAVDPPIFLRFINLLINDAIYLLDESLTNLQAISKMQNAVDNGEWERLPANERQQNMANMQQIGMFARYDNILGRDTINILKLLTSECSGIFCHAAMVDRIASMLNYFLLHLVGPSKRNLIVKDKKEFEFDPAHTVREICRIYINLEKSDSFCLAISQDGRSYSHQLFEQAERVLVKIGGGQLIGEIQEFAAKVLRWEQLEKVNQEALTDAPDDYLDPIMSTLMLDPVILPSSKVTVDRTTIARHLLSDQTDPFNRSPLTMDQIIPDLELKAKIDAWIVEKRQLYQAAINQSDQKEKSEQILAGGEGPSNTSSSS